MILTDAVIATAHDGAFSVTRDAAIVIDGDRIAWAGKRADLPAAQAAHDNGLGVNAGHDLNRDNLTPFLCAVPQVHEVSIGHALIADALELGYAEATRAYLRCIADARG